VIILRSAITLAATVTFSKLVRCLVLDLHYEVDAIGIGSLAGEENASPSTSGSRFD